MKDKNNLQHQLLTRIQQERQVVTVFTTNGYQMKGRITAFDQFTILVEIRDVQQLVYKHAISTIQPDRPVSLEEEAE